MRYQVQKPREGKDLACSRNFQMIQMIQMIHRLNLTGLGHPNLAHHKEKSGL